MAPIAEFPAPWLNWIAENQARGVPPADIIRILVDNGFDAHAAHDQVARAGGHPPAAAKPAVQKPAKADSLMAIYSGLWKTRGRAEVDRLTGLSGADFFRWYYAHNRPVVLLDAMHDWPALDRWSPDYLGARCGNPLVEVMTGRAADSQYELNSERHKTKMPLDQFLHWIRTAGETNDFYMVANNRSFDSGNLRLLLEDIRLFDGILDPSNVAARLFFWFGPAGTVTPLHHDVMNVLLAQVVGRKLVTLIPSFETHLVYNRVGVYSEVDVEAPDYSRYPLFRDVSRHQVLLQPGEALFIPVGWWHHVRSLDVSISVSFTNFLAPNEYAWENGRYE